MSRLKDAIAKDPIVNKFNVFEYQDMPNHDLKFVDNVESVEAAMKMCCEMTGCVGFGYVARRKAAWFKNGTGSMRPDWEGTTYLLK